MSTHVEYHNVFETYEEISGEFDKTRHHVWPCVRQFIDSIKNSENMLEIGCGNGKNLMYRQDITRTGIDFVPSFVKMCKDRGLNVNEGNAIELQFSDNSFDNCISIAVFHHLSSEERRIKALKEITRVLRNGGRGLVVCWAYEQSYENSDSGISRNIKNGDQYISWKNKSHSGEEPFATLTAGKNDRYYHCYDKSSFEKYTECISVSRKKIWWQKGNWIMEFTK
jgi:ubiquinone/menaquinone biosynthesis C-methylase UbiE